MELYKSVCAQIYSVRRWKDNDLLFYSEWANTRNYLACSWAWLDQQLNFNNLQIHLLAARRNCLQHVLKTKRFQIWRIFQSACAVPRRHAWYRNQCNYFFLAVQLLVFVVGVFVAVGHTKCCPDYEGVLRLFDVHVLQRNEWSFCIRLGRCNYFNQTIRPYGFQFLLLHSLCRHFLSEVWHCWSRYC